MGLSIIYVKGSQVRIHKLLCFNPEDGFNFKKTVQTLVLCHIFGISSGVFSIQRVCFTVNSEIFVNSVKMQLSDI